jgi:hypothetical protein
MARGCIYALAVVFVLSCSGMVFADAFGAHNTGVKKRSGSNKQDKSEIWKKICDGKTGGKKYLTGKCAPPVQYEVSWQTWVPDCQAMYKRAVQEMQKQEAQDFPASPPPKKQRDYVKPLKLK